MIEFVRIDDRLIHGQVATTWMKMMNIEQAIVVNDELAKDTMQLTILEISAPDGVRVHLFGVGQFVEICKKNPIKRRTMLVFTNPADILTCIRGGVEIDKINVGGMSYKTGKQKLTKFVSATPEDMEVFRELVGLGVDVYLQMVPNDKITRITQFLS